ncbi:acyltransferase family protein [Deminuibacter soli]|uniref:Acyltransferase n=1 Tax=Deminuibacter soli TaxID=2291815 RepID=A0A3E1NHL4_9BACT|nr:acyltransferase [Deminuibacter soli]RFM27397.1 acyltransferase [Deminuibacter soli]
MEFSKLLNAISPGKFRLLLAFIVVVYHMHMASFLGIGHYAVYVFFVLSGYWIFKMFNEKYSQYEDGYSVYLRSRLFRLMPVYWLVLFAAVVLFCLFKDPSYGYNSLMHLNIAEIATKNFFVFGLNTIGIRYIGSAWSLDVELQFYIVAPLLLLLARKINIISVLVISVALWIILYRLPESFQANGYFFFYLPYFLIGAAIYLLNIYCSEKTAIAGLVLAGALVLANYLVPFVRNNYMLNRDAVLFGFNYHEVLVSVLTCCTIPYVTRNVRLKPAKKDGLYSSMSYVIYLLHWPLNLICLRLAKGKSYLATGMYLLGYLIICIALTYVISAFVDKYFEDKRRQWLLTRNAKLKLAV